MINDGNLKTVEDFHSYLKDMSKDALQKGVKNRTGSGIRIF